MRERRVIVLAKACAVVGIALAAYGTVTDQVAPFRGGMITLIVAAAVHLHITSRADTHAVLAQQASLARLSTRDRQRYAELGYKAALLDALTDDAPTRGADQAGAADVIDLPHARRAPQMRRDGSA